MLANNFKFAVLVAFGVMIPDLYLGLFRHVISAALPVSNLAAIALFALLLSFSKSKFLAWALFVAFAAAQLIQLNHWLYFGIPIHSQDISKAFYETDEIWATGLSILPKVGETLAAWGVSVVVIGYALKTFPKRERFRVADIAICLILVTVPTLSFLKTNGPGFFYTKPTASTAYNTLRAFSDWVARSLHAFEKISYPPYGVSYGEPKAANIVLIMGESQSGRYMGLYGYSKNNTPFLSGLKNDPNFAYAKGVSSGVCTRTVLQLFFNVVNNPGDVDNLRKKTGNLFRLAKKQGYRTIVLSAQSGEKLFHDTGLEFVDSLKTEKDMGEELKTKGDAALVDRFKKETLNDKNFVVLHLRHVHSPYTDHSEFLPKEREKTLSSDKDYPSREIREYSNAIAYNDFWVKLALGAIIKRLPKNVVVIFTSDHGELLGERGLYGHNLMEPEVADVPIWIYDTVGHSKRWLNSRKTHGHYDLGKHVAELMGATIVNPSETGAERYVHGSNLYADYAYLTWRQEGDSPVFTSGHAVGELRTIRK